VSAINKRFLRTYELTYLRIFGSTRVEHRRDIAKFVNPSIRKFVSVIVGIGCRLTGDAVAPLGPPCQIFVPAALAAERLPPFIHGMLPAQDAHPRVAHPIHFNQFVIGDW
jgi:hypothetical protein